MSPAGGAGAAVDAPPTKVRLDSLTGARWWAAFGVFIFHMNSFAPLPLLGPFSKFGNYGVAFFFILSGFVLTWSARPGTSIRNFYWRRFARIYPALLVAVALGLPVFYRVGLQEIDPSQWWIKPVSVVGILAALLLVQAWSSNPAILFGGSPVSWTLTVEAFFYALHPFVNRFLGRGRQGRAILLIAIVLAWEIAYPTLMLIDKQGWWASIPLPVLRVGEFFLGMSVATLVRNGWRPRIPALPLCILFVANAVLYVGLKFSGAVPTIVQLLGSFQALTVIVIFTLLIIALAIRDLEGRPSAFRAKWMVDLGTWSFAFYLVHSTVMYGVATFVGARTASWGNLVWYPVVFVLSLLAAWLLYRLVEHPVELRMRRWGDRRFAPRMVR